jgi:RNA polymerase sigma-B factor
MHRRDLDRDGGLPTDELLRRYAAKPDPATLEQLVVRFTPLVRKLALRYARTSEPLEDLEQVGSLGLVKAIDRFDPERGFAFTSFAVPTILGEIKRSIRDTAWSAHVPRAMQERVAALRRANDVAAGEHGRAPTVGELADRLGWDPEDVAEAMSAARALSATSLDVPTSGEDEDASTLGELLGEEDDAYDRVDDRDAIESALPVLTDMQRAVLDLRFRRDLKQSEIATELGCSQMQVSRVLRGALERLSTVAVHRSQDSAGANPAPRL